MHYLIIHNFLENHWPVANQYDCKQYGQPRLV